MNEQRQQFEMGGRDRERVFGDRVGDMKREIANMHRQGQFRGGLPVGPIGLFVHLKDERWMDAVNAAMSMTFPYAFIVQEHADIATLQKVFEKYQYGKFDKTGRFLQHFYDIYCAKNDARFNASSGEVGHSRDWTCVLRELEVRFAFYIC
jgi:hypothetical protein